MNKLPVFYNSRMNVQRCDSFSPSPGKPRAAVDEWRKLGLPISFEFVEPAMRAELKRVHAAAYVDGVLDCTRVNGFGNTDSKVALSLPYTSGSMLSAARYALANNVSAVSPTSGFHHAGFDSGGGFCTFNGLMVTAVNMLVEERVKRVAIIDCDMHYGDGTDEIIERLKLDGVVEHFTAGGTFRKANDAARFFRSLKQACQLADDRCDLVLYQAGADPHVDDPLGGWLTTEQLLQRDRIVFSTVKKPLVWNLAGGYQKPIEKVLEIHTNTFKAWAESRGLLVTAA